MVIALTNNSRSFFRSHSTTCGDGVGRVISLQMLVSTK